MAGKIRAAVEARTAGIVIIARTDAIATEGLDAAIARGRAYVEAGADVLFLEAPISVDQIERIGEVTSVPLLINMFEGGKTRWSPPTDSTSFDLRS